MRVCDILVDEYFISCPEILMNRSIRLGNFTFCLEKCFSWYVVAAFTMLKMQRFDKHWSSQKCRKSLWVAECIPVWCVTQ